MFASYPLLAIPLASYPVWYATFSNPYSISYAGLDLSGATSTAFTVSTIDIGGTPSALIDTSKKPRRDGGLLLQHNWDKRVIKLTGAIRGTDRADFLNNVDTLKKTFATVNWILQYNYWTTGTPNMRVIECYPASIICEIGTYNVTWCRWEVTLESVDPHWIDPDVNTQSNSNTATVTDSISYAGSISTPLRTLVTINSVTGGTGFGVGYGASTVTVTTSLTAGDFLDFNSETLSVQKNWVDIDYSGAFLDLSTTTNPVTLTPIATTIQYDYTFVYFNNFL